MSDTEVIAAIDDRLERVRTRALDISFNELLDMHEDGELKIDPAYQRLFRWDAAKQSRFIESILLEMPIPPIYVIELGDNKYELIDGLQRISTWLHFRGRHPRRTDELGNMTALTLEECDIVPSLDGHTYDTLPAALKTKLKRHFVRVEVIRKESDARLRYYMFKRLNTGGEKLADQEVRNCTVRLLDPTFNDFISAMAKNPDFEKLTDTLSEKKKEQMYREELVLRFLAFKNDRASYTHIVGEFLTDYMEKVSDPSNKDNLVDIEKESRTFKKTMRVLHSSLGERAFSTVHKSSRNATATFSVLHYEAMTLGLQAVLENLDDSDLTQMQRLKTLLEETKTSDDLRDVVVGGGQNYAGPLAKRIDFVAARLAAGL